MKMYIFEIKEELSKKVAIKAESENEAWTIVDEKYRASEIELDYSNFVDYEIHLKDKK